MRLPTGLSLRAALPAAALVLPLAPVLYGPAPHAAAAAAAAAAVAPAPPACAQRDSSDFPIAARLHDGPDHYARGGGWHAWHLELRNTTATACRAIHPIAVFVDGAHALRPEHIRLEFLDPYADGGTWRPVSFETTDEDENIGVFDDHFKGFTVAAGKTVDVRVRTRFANDAPLGPVTANVIAVQRRSDDGDWVGQSNEYQFRIDEETEEDTEAETGAGAGAETGAGAGTETDAGAGAGTGTGAKTDTDTETVTGADTDPGGTVAAPTTAPSLKPSPKKAEPGSDDGTAQNLPAEPSRTPKSSPAAVPPSTDPGASDTDPGLVPDLDAEASADPGVSPDPEAGDADAGLDPGAGTDPGASTDPDAETTDPGASADAGLGLDPEDGTDPGLDTGADVDTGTDPEATDPEATDPGATDPEASAQPSAHPTTDPSTDPGYEEGSHDAEADPSAEADQAPQLAKTGQGHGPLLAGLGVLSVALLTGGTVLLVKSRRPKP